MSLKYWSEKKMNQYVTGSVIKRQREKCRLTQNQLAEKLNVSDKAVSKWETGRGFPDISMLESLAKVLNVSVIELLSGEEISNSNRSANIKNSKMYVCPVCGNIIYSVGQAAISCCGILLPPLEPEEAFDDTHKISVEKSEDEFFVQIDHPMTKEHYISFIAALGVDGIHMKKLYPEMDAQARFKICGTHRIFAYCNRDGLFSCSPKR